MFPLPVAAREVREASRQPRTYAWRAATASAALTVMGLYAWFSRYSFTRGHDLFVAISTVAFIYCLVAGVLRTADTISEEKRENTLGLLFLTDLKGVDILLGKLLSSSVNCLFGLLALIPMLAVPILMGGVQWIEFVRIVLSLFVTLLLSISWGFLISSLFRLSVVTISMGLAVMLFFSAGLPLVALVFDEQFHARELAAAVFVFSPTHCHTFAFALPAPAYIQHYWRALSINFTLALTYLCLAVFFLPRFWQEAPKNKKTERWRDRVRALRFGKSKAKKRLRTRLLNQNPFFWLANREQVSSAGLMIASTVILLIALAVGIGAFNTWRAIEQIMISWMMALALIHALIAFRVAMAASYRLAEDRRSGALELLLGTEISVRELLRGYWMALGRQFFGPGMIVFFGGIFAVMMVLLIFSDTVHSSKIIETAIEIVRRVFTRGADKEAGLAFFMVVSIQLMLALNWIALIWVGMWLGLRERRPGAATWVTLSTVLVPPWILLIVGAICAAEMGLTRGIQPDEAMSALLIAGWILGGAHVAILCWWARRNLIIRFREAAADRHTGPRRITWPKVRHVGIRFAIAGACVVFALCGARYLIDRNGNKLWAAALAAHPNFQLEKTATTRSVPDDQNLAQAPLLASFSKVGSSPNWISWNLSSLSGSRYNGEIMQWDWPQRHRMFLARIEDNYIERKVVKERRETPAATVLAGLEVYDEQLNELHEEAAARPLLQFPTWASPALLPANVPYGLYYPRQSDIRGPIRQLIETLALRTCARIATGSNDTADLFLALRLTEGIKDIPNSQQQYRDMIIDCVQPIYDGLAAGVWKNDELKKIQDYFASCEFWSGFDEAREDYIRQIIRESEAVVKGRHSNGASRQNWLARQAPIGFRRKWEAETLVWGLDTLPKIVDSKSRRIDPRGLRDLPSTRPDPPYNRRYPDQVILSIRSLSFVQTTTDQIVLACALERFRNDHGALPKTLDELTPNYLATIPNDVFTGAPLRYVLNSDGRNYTIYGVGPDGADDHGSPASMNGSWMLWQEQAGSDWVWNSAPVPSPALAPTRKIKPPR